MKKNRGFVATLNNRGFSFIQVPLNQVSLYNIFVPQSVEGAGESLQRLVLATPSRRATLGPTAQDLREPIRDHIAEVIVLSPLYKLSPLHACDRQHFSTLAPAHKALPYMSFESAVARVICPQYDLVPHDHITLFITNLRRVNLILAWRHRPRRRFATLYDRIYVLYVDENT
ncbi:jg21807 [Pararge aegeria aegeria]|uniref:Jg21807 protein n=1 Tax=Pararge aegeria aegeria TaxID=348720 RepID=A0A8S4QI99_9NEOP|nr:jg21807 [Pararge aegeria aegeria]